MSNPVFTKIKNTKHGFLFNDKETIFVFGSNLDGQHGLGAALDAARYYGAQHGIGEGPTGSCYALPTKGHRLAPRTFEELKASVDRFLDYATANPQLVFRLSRFGCGLAGKTDTDMAALVANAPANVIKPGIWRTHNDPQQAFPVIVAGGRELAPYRNAIMANLEQRIPAMQEMHRKIIIVSGGAKGVDTIGENFAEAHGLQWLRFPAPWDDYPDDKAVGMLRNRTMGWFSSSLIAFPGAGSGTRGMISYAKNTKLAVEVIELSQLTTELVAPSTG